MRPNNVILSEGIVNFGKYKDRRFSGLQLVTHDPGYVLWCVSAVVAMLDKDVSDLLAEWEKANPREAKRVIASAARVAEGKEVVRVATRPTVVAYADATPSETNDDPDWGSW